MRCGEASEIQSWQARDKTFNSAEKRRWTALRSVVQHRWEASFNSAEKRRSTALRSVVQHRWEASFNSAEKRRLTALRSVVQQRWEASFNSAEKRRSTALRSVVQHRWEALFNSAEKRWLTGVCIVVVSYFGRRYCPQTLIIWSLWSFAPSYASCVPSCRLPACLRERGNEIVRMRPNYRNASRLLNIIYPLDSQWRV